MSSIGAGKAILFAREPYDVLRVKNTPVECVSSIMDCAIGKTTKRLYRQSQFYVSKRYVFFEY
jgi:hypothetical protein